MADPLALEMLDLAVRLAKEAGAIAFQRQDRFTVTWKADDSPVTDVDHAMQHRIVETISRTYPDHAVCAEETVQPSEHRPSRTQARYCWVIDPLDGTRNYASGLPCFTTSIAILDRGRPHVAVVLEHNLDYLYTAVAGAGAKLNDKPIRAVEVPAGDDLLIGIPSSKSRFTVNVLQRWVATNGFVLRDLGSTALHLGFVASGALGACFASQCKIWDLAAGALLVTESGGRVTDTSGNDRASFDLSLDPDEDLPVLAGAPSVLQRLLDSIRDLQC